jgi:hypothetical protein
MKRLAVALVLVLAACGQRHPVAYRPVAFGENGHCYYAQDPAETVALQRSGLCEPGWQPMLMPSYWHYRYWNYYSSAAYYQVYVPPASRTSYAGTERSWGSSNRSAIDAAAPGATYKGSNGQTVSAEKIGVAKYGGGARFGPPGVKFGGGARTAPAAPQVPATPNNPPGSPSNAPSTPSKAPSAPKAPSGGGSKSGGSRSGGGFGGGHR